MVFTGDGTAEIICDSINETRNFRMKYVENHPTATYLDRIVTWDEVSRTYPFMKTEELRINSVTFQSNTTATIACVNSGADTITVTAVTLDDASTEVTFVAAFGSDGSLAKGASGSIQVTTSAMTSGAKYTFAVLTAGGNKYTYTTTAVWS